MTIVGPELESVDFSVELNALGEPPTTEHEELGFQNLVWKDT